MKAPFLLVCCLLVASVLSAPHILHITADDFGRQDLGLHNGNHTFTPNLDELVRSGIFLDNYYTFKICSPSRASVLTGRYPWGAGFYNMAQDNDHTTTNFTLLSALLKQRGYSTHAIGKWDVGFINRKSSATYRGFDSFLGYYLACESDYWYHWAAMPCMGKRNVGTDLSFNVGTKVGGAEGLNGTYNADIFTARALDIINTHSTDKPLYIYLAYQNMHESCDFTTPLRLNAPCSTVDMYGRVANDSFKVQSAMATELDRGVAKVIAALQSKGMWNDTLVVFHSDNGGPLTHTTNYPLRGGKWTFWEGGVRVSAFLSGPVVPLSRRGSTWSGMAHASDWYRTLVNGVAGTGQTDITANTGTRPPDGHDLWGAIISDGESPRTEVIHQVSNQYFSADATSMRMGDYKLIQGNPGDSRILKWPEFADHVVPFGTSGGVKEPGTNHCRAPVTKQQPGKFDCKPHCLFNVVQDPSESNDISGDPKYAALITNMTQRLAAAGASGPPPAYVYPNETVFRAVVFKQCLRMLKTGFLEPADV